MRRFILRTSIFHLDLTSMSLGKTVGKLVHSIKQSSTLVAVHMSNNNVPLEYVYNMDKELGVPETQGNNRIAHFRPLEKERKSTVMSSSNDQQTKLQTQANPSARGADRHANYGNVTSDLNATVELDPYDGGEDEEHLLLKSRENTL